MTTRQEHLEWCKGRALEYCDRGDAQRAIISMLSDLSKHDETRDHMGIQLTGTMMLNGLLGTTQAVRKHIEGFN